ncbi:63558be5-e624-4caa-806c-1936b85374f2 [Thermothielavioides terrestris]|uniref:63558be5-e624-4caa-806c-1936b85374f2 n=1 Tax=Thermothielavioides terrestris TaxID=2587410 RepID=A0A3S4F6M8_9PEZI|nr:63558be5-e624-4caa-806c-1936b85374f2 [Thermothielavioides terrestris]
MTIYIGSNAFNKVQLYVDPT